MEEDDCYLWTDASSSSGSSATAMSESVVKYESNDEGDSDKVYKKKLQKKLFKDKTDSHVKQELLKEVGARGETAAVKNESVDHEDIPHHSKNSFVNPKESKLKKKKNKEIKDSYDDAPERNIEIVVNCTSNPSNSQSKKGKFSLHNNTSDNLEDDVKHKKSKKEKKRKKNQHTEDIENDTDQNNDVDSDKAYKKKLHKKLFKEKTDFDVKEELLKEVGVKGEPERVGDRNELAAREDISHYNDTFQNLKEFKLKTKKNKKNSDAHFDCSERHIEKATETNDSTTNSQSRKRKLSLQSNTDNLEDNVKCRKTEKEKKKKKVESPKNMEKSTDQVTSVSEIFNENEDDEAIKNNRSIKHSHHTSIADRIQFEEKSTDQVTSVSEIFNENEDDEAIKNNRSIKHSHHTSIADRIQFEEKSTDQVTSVSEIFNENEDDEAIKNNRSIKHSHHTSIADRIQFEDDGEGELQDDTHRTYLSSPLKQYLRFHPYLQTITSKSDNESVLSKDDEVWLFTCPHDIDIMCLKNTDISIDGKCKLKHNNQTYIGKLERPVKAGIVDFEIRGPILKSFKSKGCITFHKKIPKPHVAYDKLMMDNHSECIPLPDTKCRHPLFGVDYEKFISIPSTVRTSLMDSNFEGKLVDEVKKNKSKLDAECKEIDMKKSSRKRKVNAEEEGGDGGTEHQTHDEPRKRRRRQPDPVTNSWDSEKAIEHNLFNF